MLMHFLLEKHAVREPITQAALLTVVNKKYKEFFPKILMKTSEHLELASGLELKEVKPSGHSYTLTSNLDLTNDGSVNSGQGFPKSGLLMPLLGVIFLNDRYDTEEDIWGFLSVLENLC